jgi:hypothetical protein
VTTVSAGYIQSNISFKLHIDASRFQTSICAILANVLRFGFPRSPPIYRFERLSPMKWATAIARL